MKLIYTAHALKSLKEILHYLIKSTSREKAQEVRQDILNKAGLLLANPDLGQKEEYLEHLGLSHRRIVESHYKIIYRVSGENIYITDIFDSRQNPKKMRG